MKIAHLIAQFYPHVGGAEVCVHNVCEGLAANGHDATVICTTAPAKTAPKTGYKTIHLPTKTCGLLRRIPLLGEIHLFFQIWRLQKIHKFDIWQVTMGYPLGVYAWKAFKFLKVPAVLRCCGEDIQKMPEINYGYRLDPERDRLISNAYKNYDGFVAITPTVRKEYLELGIDAEKIKIIPNGVQLSKFNETPRDEEFRKEITGKRDIPVLLTVGRYHPKKGFNSIPAIAAKLKEEGIDFVWILAGRGNSKLREICPDLDNLNIKIIEDCSGGEEKSFLLPSAKLIGIYKSADIFVFPTLIEALGIVILEAFAAGLPVVSTDVPGVCDIIDHEVNGLKLPPEKPEIFAREIERLLKNPAEKAKLKDNALSYIRNNDWPEVAMRYMEFYKEVIARHGKK